MRKPRECERLHSQCTIAGLWAAVYSDTVQPVPESPMGLSVQGLYCPRSGQRN